MIQNKTNRFMCSIWLLVPVISLLRLNQRMIDIYIDIDAGTACFAMPPVTTYNGLQLLLHGNLVNGYNFVVVNMSNPGFVILKMMIAMQLVCDVILVSICLREWREKQSSMVFMRLRGVLSMGYLLTAFAMYRLIPLCCKNLRVGRYTGLSSYAHYYQYELEKNVLLSIGVVVLFIVTWLFYRTKSVYRFVCYFWFFVPVLSLVILTQPVMAIEVDAMGKPIMHVLYNGFQLLHGGGLVNEYKDLVIDGKNPGYVVMRIMFALQLFFDVIIVFIGLWEWRKKCNPKFFLGIRGILAMGYVLTAHTIYQFVEEWSEHIEIHHESTRFFAPRISYISLYGGTELNVSFSIGVAILFILTLITFLFSKRRKYDKVLWMP